MLFEEIREDVAAKLATLKDEDVTALSVITDVASIIAAAKGTTVTN